MATDSKIEWTDTTWNPVVGCAKVSPGCANCYAETMSKRLAAMARADAAKGKDPGRKSNYSLVVRDDGHWNGRAVTVPEALPDPLGWKKPRRVFVNSMSDLFHADVPFDFIDRVFAVMALCPQHTFQVLTKRPERMAEYCRDRMQESGGWDLMLYNGYFPWPDDASEEQIAVGDKIITENLALPNVWLGTSIENQATADARIPHLLKCPAAVRFLSCEPLLGAVDLEPFFWGYHCRGCGYLPDDEIEFRVEDRHPVDDSQCPKCKRDARWPDGFDLGGIDWVIIGGESGPNARPFDIQWARDIIRQCKAAGVPVFVKQVGARPCEGDLRQRDRHDYITVRGRKVGGETAWMESGRWLNLTDPKGGDIDEWPEDLRVREMPGRHGPSRGARGARGGRDCGDGVGFEGGGAQ